jgi:hypothetical protein
MCLACEEDAKFFVAYFGDTGGNPWRPAHRFGVAPDRLTDADEAAASSGDVKAGPRFTCERPDGE